MDAPVLVAASRVPIRSFMRDGFTLSVYVLFMVLAYTQTLVNPVTPFLANEMGLSYFERSLHLTAQAGGAAIAAVLGGWWVARFGLRAVVLAGLAGMVVSGLLLVSGLPHVAASVGGVLILGIGSASVQFALQAALANHHREHSGLALSEAATLATPPIILAPFIVGLTENIGVGWRWAVYLSAILLVLALAYVSRMHLGTSQAQSTQAKDIPTHSGFRWKFWLYSTVIALTSAAEWSIAFWGISYLNQFAGVRIADAAALMSLFPLAMFLGRLIGTWLVRQYSPSVLLMAAILLSMAGFALLWLFRVPTLNLVGLFLVGLGLANCYPMGLSLALRHAEMPNDIATPQLHIGAAVVIAAAPLVLGGVADQIGLHGAYGIVGAVLILSLIALVQARRM